MPAQTTTLLTNAELTALHTETINAAKAARTLANIARRATTLLEDGYEVRSYDDLHVVESPAGKKYAVWHGAEVGYSCDCPCFAEWNTCKHLLAVDAMKQDAADGDALDALEDAGYDVHEYRY